MSGTNAMFGWNTFREDGKRGVKNKGENVWKWCLVRRGRGGKNW